jgi:hypothetical protein
MWTETGPDLPGWASARISQCRYDSRKFRQRRLPSTRGRSARPLNRDSRALHAFLTPSVRLVARKCRRARTAFACPAIHSESFRSLSRSSGTQRRKFLDRRIYRDSALRMDRVVRFARRRSRFSRTGSSSFCVALGGKPTSTRLCELRLAMVATPVPRRRRTSDHRPGRSLQWIRVGSSPLALHPDSNAGGKYGVYSALRSTRVRYARASPITLASCFRVRSRIIKANTRFTQPLTAVGPNLRA